MVRKSVGLVAGDVESSASPVLLCRKFTRHLDETRLDLQSRRMPAEQVGDAG